MNIYLIAAEPSTSGGEIEDQYLQLVAAVLTRFRTQEIDFLEWLPNSVELEAPAWVLAGVWGVYEVAVWLSMPIGVPGLAHSPGFAAHAGGAVLGVVVALGLDAHESDPFQGLAITTEGFARITERIAALKLPCVIVQEGGYVSEARGANLISALRGFLEAAI